MRSFAIALNYQSVIVNALIRTGWNVVEIVNLPKKTAIIVSVFIVLACIAAQLLPHSGQLLIRYDRTGIQDAELWRLFSGHLAHLGWVHLWLNSAALILLAVLFESAWRTSDIVWGGLLCALSISLGLYFLYPSIQWYVGLSGVLHGWFAIASIRLWFSQRGFASVLLLALGTKLVFENLAGPATGSSWLGGEVIEQAHLLGAGSGLIFACLDALLRARLPEHT